MVESWLHLTYDSTVSALQCGAGARDCSTGAGAAEDGAAGCAVERWTWAVGARRRRAAGQSGARADALASSRALEKEEEEEKGWSAAPLWWWIVESTKYTTLIKSVNDLRSFDLNWMWTFFQHEL